MGIERIRNKIGKGRCPMSDARYVEVRIVSEHILLNCWETIK
jgi:hypothetical protein